MRMTILTAYIAFLLCTVTGLCEDQGQPAKGGKQYGGSTHFEGEILKYEAKDRKHPPPQGAIVCIGSSSMQGWRWRIKEDLAPLTVISRGFGGSNMNDALYYADRIVIPYKPRAVIVYEGDNDVAKGIPSRRIIETAQKFADKIHEKLPDCRIYFLSIKPSISRWEKWPRMQQTNKLLAELCEKDKRLTFIDVGTGMLNDEGKPREELFREDMLHMKREGYLVWRDAARPILLKAEQQYEVTK